MSEAEYYDERDDDGADEVYIEQCIEDGICPECGRQLVERKNSYTRELFWGCSDYPRCDFTHPI